MIVPSLSSLVAASLLIGQTSQTQVISPPPGSAKTYIYPSGTTPTTVVNQPGDAPRGTWTRSWQERPILTKIQGWFGRGPKQNDIPMPIEAPSFGTPTTTIPASTPVLTPAPTPKLTPAPAPSPSSDFLRKMPASLNKNNATPLDPVVEPRTTTKATPTPATEAVAKKSPLSPHLVDKVGRDEKFEWVTGQLEIENGQHVLYYATPETVDPYHGRLVLQTRADLSSFKRGDLVSAHGQVARTTGILNGPPAYRATSVDKIESAQR